MRTPTTPGRSSRLFTPPTRRRTPVLPGVVFENAPLAVIQEVRRDRHPRTVIYGNARGQIFNGDVARWSFAAVRLDRRMPHIVLENVRGSGLIASEAKEGVRRGQRLRLEGDFDRTFSLHCAAGYEQDALNLFTPDVMARVLEIRSRLDMDIEIVDDWLLIYAPKPIDATHPEVAPALEELVGQLEEKLGAWVRWRDGREADPARVADAGRRVRPVSTWRWVWRGAAVTGAMVAFGVLWEAFT